MTSSVSGSRTRPAGVQYRKAPVARPMPIEANMPYSQSGQFRSTRRNSRGKVTFRGVAAAAAMRRATGSASSAALSADSSSRSAGSAAVDAVSSAAADAGEGMEDDVIAADAKEGDAVDAGDALDGAVPETAGGAPDSGAGSATDSVMVLCSPLRAAADGPAVPGLPGRRIPVRVTPVAWMGDAVSRVSGASAINPWRPDPWARARRGPRREADPDRPPAPRARRPGGPRWEPDPCPSGSRTCENREKSWSTYVTS